MADRQPARSIVIIRKVSVSSSHLHFTIDLYVMESPPFDVMTGAPALEALQGCLNFRLQQVTLESVSKKASFPFKYAVIEVPADDNLEMDSEDFISDSNAAPNVDEDSGEDHVISLVRALYPSNDD